jgi:uncharacterized protein (DUF488 family)
MHTRQKNAPPSIFTIGHSTRTQEDFIALLKSHGIKRVIDIRTIPRSRRHPHFSREALAKALRSAGISYIHLKKLGGLKRAKANSKNLGWRNANFRGFADYMQTADFKAGIERSAKLAKTKPTALMCAEAVPWRCHRSLVADALLVRNLNVEHIISGSRRQIHKLTRFAKVTGEQITYPADNASAA